MMTRMTFSEASEILTPAQIKTLSDNVDRGAALLDQQRPSWRDKVNVSTLDMSDGSWCVLGQAFGGYYEGRVRLRIDSHKATDHGFNCHARWGDDLDWEGWLQLRDVQYAALDHFWTQKIHAEVAA
jgi:hypothetical protein